MQHFDPIWCHNLLNKIPEHIIIVVMSSTWLPGSNFPAGKADHSTIDISLMALFELFHRQTFAQGHLDPKSRPPLQAPPPARFLSEPKGTCHLRFSGIRPLRGGGYPPIPLRKKTFFLGPKTLFFAFFLCIFSPFRKKFPGKA